MSFSQYQNEIYLQGLADVTPSFTTNPAALADAARAVMSPQAYGYVTGSASTESTARANLEAFERWRIVPRMLRDATHRDLAVDVLGTAMPAPVLLAPVGVQSIVHPDGELATARAAAELGVPMILSTASAYSIEEVAEANGDGPRWFQLYWPNDEEVAASFLRRAKDSGYSTLVVTLDTWMLSWRPRDLDQAYLPFLRGTGCAVYFSDPVFRSRLAAPPEEDLNAAVGAWLPMFSGTARTWAQLPFLREHWDGPIVLKGIQHPDDARLAVDAGMDGIVVSNHGGRQVDGAIGSLDALPEIVDAVAGRLAVLFDSGVRSGADAMKALALGAQAVLLGRPFVYGLAHGGQDGVRSVLRSFLGDLDLTLGLSGHASVAELDCGLLRRV